MYGHIHIYPVLSSGMGVGGVWIYRKYRLPVLPTK